MMSESLLLETPAVLSLVDLTWIVTYQCHLDCAYCYVPTTLARKASDSTLSKPQVCDILCQARSFGAENLSLRGGEPFLRADLPAILETADLLGLRSDVITKVALSHRIIDRLAALRSLSLGISLDTTDSDIGDALLKKTGQTERLKRTCATLVKAGMNIVIEATVTRQTYDTLPALEAFCMEHGIRRLHLRAAAPHKIRAVDNLLPTADMVRVMASRAGFRDNLEVVATPAFSQRPSCGEGLDALTFLPNGVVTKCTASLSRHPKMHYGDLSVQNLRDVLLSSQRGALLKRVVESAGHLESVQKPKPGRLPCSQLVNLRLGDPLGQKDSQ